VLSAPEGTKPHRLFSIGGLGLLLLTLWPRLSSVPRVLVDGAILPQGGDSAYHLRRTMLAAEEFPSVPVFDPWMNWPAGGLCHWAPGMDFLGALLVQLSGQAPGSLEASIIVSAIPVFFGVAAVWLVVALARELVFPSTAPGIPLFCGATMALLPQAVATSRFGRVDHHIFETLCMAALALWVLRGLRKPRGVRWELAGSLILWAGLITFAGSVLYAGIATALLLLAGSRVIKTTAGPEPSRSTIIGSGGPAFLLAALATLITTGPPVADPFSFVFPSYLQPTLLVVAALALISARLGGLRGLFVAGIGVLTLLALFEGPREQLIAGIRGWLAHEDPWLASITEFQPLLGEDLFSRTSWDRAHRYFGSFGALALPLFITSIFALWRSDPKRALVFALWTGSLGILCLVQNRFGRIFVVNLALCAGLGYSALANFFPIHPRRQTATLITLLGITVLLSQPLRSSLTPSSERPPAPIEEAATFLRQSLPKDAPLEGVAAPWDMGHFLLWIAKRPVVATGFGTYLDAEGFEESRQVQLGTEMEALDWMKRRELRHIVLGAGTFLQRVYGSQGDSALKAGENGRGFINGRFAQDYPMTVSLTGGSALPFVGVPHFEQLRPIFATTASVKRAAKPLPILWLFERVESRELTGEGLPGERVLVRVGLEVHGTSWPWTAITSVASDGSWRLRIPLEPGSSTGGIDTPNVYDLSVGGREIQTLPFAKNN
jgi:asparagine N-glycosylation enzyme membrane subunit Stt3